MGLTRESLPARAVGIVAHGSGPWAARWMGWEGDEQHDRCHTGGSRGPVWDACKRKLDPGFRRDDVDGVSGVERHAPARSRHTNRSRGLPSSRPCRGRRG
ncbi:hypothetical protein VW29_06645 [Devosia limi DSM 17137]|uniref:Uncharacterized protein n=1 Tax=Devosia limi DSM 17137 TaxID=1121477 RepID=A0A0F5LSI3_9HYPH|nr:hypothetical protein VW29_06645 [Devosia limi DSM 17137]